MFSRHLPFSDLYESLIFLSWDFSIFHLSTIISPSVLFTQGFDTSSLLAKIHQSTILVPALQSHWLMMHVSMMILSYATLLGASLLSIIILI
ncbi:putative cytochrome c assembly protein [Lupinus albus]|uniref:Putative cytochrome c assembly protein n=1 Tax=Lupinus albus TaxID=3870 RepID=A0A6A4P5Z1_LUPAL|nr:putative cytochrome c assembly protein [Lupinus albus]